jgi:hypothetical protein
MLTGELDALMTSDQPFLPRAPPDFTLVTMHKSFIRKAAAAFDIFDREALAVGEFPFFGSPPFVKSEQKLLQLHVLVTVSNEDSADTTIKPTGGYQFGIDFHGPSSIS